MSDWWLDFIARRADRARQPWSRGRIAAFWLVIAVLVALMYIAFAFVIGSSPPMTSWPTQFRVAREAKAG